MKDKKLLFMIVALIVAAMTTAFLTLGLLHKAQQPPKPSAAHDYPPAVSLDEHDAIDCTDTATYRSALPIKRISDKKVKLLDFCGAAEDEKYTWDRK